MKKHLTFLSLCLPYKWRGVTPHPEIIVGDETPCIFEPTCGRRGGEVTPHSEIIVGDEPHCIF